MAPAVMFSMYDVWWTHDLGGFGLDAVRWLSFERRVMMVAYQ